LKAFERYRLHLTADSMKESASTIVVAFIADVLVAIAKTVAAVLTASASMLAEAVHSWVDTSNEFFLFGASRTARRGPDEGHVLGYGRESYVWSLFASVMMLTVGGVIGVTQGIRQLGSTNEVTHYLSGYIVIAASFLFEGAAFLQTLRQVQKAAANFGKGGRLWESQRREVFEQVYRTSDSPMRAVFFEDFTALIALALAALGMVLHQLTGKVVYDAAGSILIGVLMAMVALLQINLNRRYLEGKPLAPEMRAEAIKQLKSFPEVERVTFLYGEVIGPDRIALFAGVTIAGEHTQTELAYILRDLEHRLVKNTYVGIAILSLATPDEEDARP